MRTTSDVEDTKTNNSSSGLQLAASIPSETVPTTSTCKKYYP